MSSSVSGIDVSHWQGTVDWNAVKNSGTAFAFAKATEGTSGVDSQFHTNWDAMGQAGLLRGAYHFYSVGSDPKAQAEHFIASVKLGAGDLPPMVDIETSGSSSEGNSNLVADLHKFLSILKDQYGVGAFIYTGPSYWNAHFDDSFSDYPLWVAEYGVSQPKPVTGWKYWTIWQHSQTGSVPGVAGDVDLDTFNGGLDQLQRFLIPG